MPVADCGIAIRVLGNVLFSFHNRGMFRVDRKELHDVIMTAIAMQPKKVRRRWSEGFYYSWDEEVIAHLIHTALDHVFDHDAVLVRPDPTFTIPKASHGVVNSRVQYHGKWGESEPWPDAFGPQPSDPTS